MKLPVEIFIPGTPAPGGSKRAFRHPRTGKMLVVDACKRNKPWRNTVATIAKTVYKEGALSGPLRVHFAFHLPRPKSHHKSGDPARPLRESAPAFPTSKPDTTKLVRAAEDALTGILWGDDSQIVEQAASKSYATEIQAPGLIVWMEPIDE